MTGRRHILGVPLTFMHRTWTNDKVLATMLEDTQIHIKTHHYYYNTSRITFLGHILRVDMTDPLKQVTCEHDDLKLLQACH